MGRWKPKGKQPVPEWAEGAPKHLRKEILERFPKCIPPYAMVRQLLAHFDVSFYLRFGRVPEKGESVFCDPASETPKPATPEQIRQQVGEVAILCGFDPAYIYAFHTVGVWVTLEQIPLLMRDESDPVMRWIMAVEQHRAEFPPDA